MQKKTVLANYDEKIKAEKEMKLKKGDLYFWVIRKDGHYINVLDGDGKSHTSYLNEDHLTLIQKEDHLKVITERERKIMEKIWD